MVGGANFVFLRLFQLADGSVVSLGVFLSQEMSRFNDLVAVIAKSLVDLKRAIKGLIVMSGPLEEMFKCFVFQQIPPVWEAVSFPSLKPLAAWQVDFFKRLDMVDKWLREGPPTSFWIPGFFFPQGFMTAVLQTHARKTSIPIDTLSFKTQMTDRWEQQIVETPEHGAYMYVTLSFSLGACVCTPSLTHFAARGLTLDILRAAAVVVFVVSNFSSLQCGSIHARRTLRHKDNVDGRVQAA